MIDSRKAFEASTAERFPGLDLSLDAEGDYDDLDAQQHWETWQASRQALDGGPVYVLLSCNSDSPEPTFVEIETEEGVSVSVPWHHHDGFDRVGPLYTHPASADGAEVWEKAMMAAIGEDGPESVADAIRRLKAGSVPEGFSSLAEATLAGCKCVLYGKENRHWPCPIHASCKRPNLGQRKADQVGTTIGVLVQNKDGEVCAVTDLGRCTWLRQNVTGAGDRHAVSVPEEWRSVMQELSDDLESEVEARKPGELDRRIERDLIVVKQARELLEEQEQGR